MVVVAPPCARRRSSRPAAWEELPLALEGRALGGELSLLLILRELGGVLCPHPRLVRLPLSGSSLRELVLSLPLILREMGGVLCLHPRLVIRRVLDGVLPLHPGLVTPQCFLLLSGSSLRKLMPLECRLRAMQPGTVRRVM